MKRPNPPSIITVAVITTVTIIFWIFFSVYQILTSEPDVNVPEELLRPINPTLNQEILSELENKINFKKDDVTHFSAGNVDSQNQVTETEITDIPEVTGEAATEAAEIEPNIENELNASPSSDLFQ